VYWPLPCFRCSNGQIHERSHHGPEIQRTGAGSTDRRQVDEQRASVRSVGIVLLIAIVFRNGRNTLLVLVNLPFALVGGIVAAALTGGNLSIGSLVGFVTLFGITTRNSIMMVSHFEHLVQFEGETWGLSAAIRGASERLTPVLMTATVTALGLLLLALGSGQSGKEIEGPMAVWSHRRSLICSFCRLWQSGIAGLSAPTRSESSVQHRIFQ